MLPKTRTPGPKLDARDRDWKIADGVGLRRMSSFASHLAALAVLTLGLTACRAQTTGSDAGDASDSDSGETSTQSTGEDSESSGTAGTTTGTDTETTADTDADADTDAGTTSETGVDTETDGGAECGNGVVEAGEECDDGDENGESFACLGDCTLNVCGDGHEGPEEGCDDGNLVDGDGCSAECLLEDIPPEAVMCGNKIYQCGDTIDNDNDGKIDLADPECISPCDDSELSFETNLPGQNNDCKQDCYFDDNSGSGDDKCEWNLKCDPENPGAQIGCEYDPEFQMCDLNLMQQCLDICVPLVPNGCDCFGCCEIEGQFVYLDSSPDCSLDNLGGCESCTFFEDCNNPCVPEECELCFGQDPEDLPEECDEPGCPEGVTPCLQQEDCPDEEFCLAGCCFPVVPQ